MAREIGLTIDYLIENSAFGNPRLLAGESGLSHIISSVGAVRDPAKFEETRLRELLVLTPQVLEGITSDLAQMLSYFQQQGVKGLLLLGESALFGHDVELAAESCRIPILLAENSKLDQMLLALQDAVIEQNNHILEDSKEFLESFTRVMLSGGGIQKIAQLLHHRFHNSVAIISDYYSTFMIHADAYKLNDLNRILKAEQSRCFSTEETKVLPHTHKVENDRLADELCTRIVIPIYSDTLSYGNVYIWEDSQIITEYELAILEFVTSLIALEIMKKTSLNEMENSYHAGFLYDLLSDSPEKQSKAIRNANFFEFDPEARHQVLAIEVAEHKHGEVISPNILFRLTNLMIRLLKDIAKESASKILFATLNRTVVLLYELGDSQKIVELMQGLLGQIRLGGLADLVSIGFGREYSHYEDLCKSLDEAGKAADYARQTGQKIVFYQNMGIYRILTYDSLTEERRTFAAEMLQPLIRHDQEKDAQLLVTLHHYFLCKGNMTQLSKALGIHYNTVVYRLQKICDLTAFSLEREEDLLNLQVALKIYELSKEQ